MADGNGLKQARDRILQAAREVEQLSRSDLSPGDFFSRFVGLLTSASGARAGAVWLRDGGGRLGCAAESGLEKLGFAGDEPLRAWNGEVLSSIVASGESGVHRPPERNGTSDAPIVIAAALHAGERCAGAVELFHKSETSPEARVAHLQFVEQMCGYASRFLASREAVSPAGWLKFRDEFEALSLRMHRSLDVERVCAVVASDGRALLGCDRVSVAVARGRRMIVQAVSGQETVHRRSNLVRAMSHLAKTVSAARTPLFFTGQSEPLSPAVTRVLTKYLEESTTPHVAVLPLFDNPAPRDDEETSAARSKPEKPRKLIGCLIVDGSAEERVGAKSQDATLLLADHTSAALSNALAHHRIFLLPVWRFLGRQWERLRGWRLAMAALIVGLLGAGIAALVVVPWDYRVAADGRLMPVVQRQVFAPWDGEVVAIHVRDGDRVKTGDPLLTIRSDEIRTQLLTTRNQLNEKRQSVLGLQAQLDEAGKKGDRDEETKLQGQVAGAIAETEGLEKQVALWESRERQLALTSPIEGTVATFRVDQLLLNRPVRRGEVLLEVMDDEGEWRLELEIPERRMGHILRSQRDSGEPHRPVDFILATSAERTFSGTLDRVATRTANAAEKGSVVEAYVALDGQRLPARSIGAEARARIECGKSSLGYVLFGDFVEWLRKTLWI